ncbi:hypothetical protein [Metaclostridioides mangenotii]|uniref:hypothetical protein n=1 Tax=Metaclostridioides mangenotii TaxID=1540 RepID=UPI00047FE167|nr:hypothetical protein [Clostridioides mangenotii]
MYNLTTQNEADIIKQILNETGPNNTINIEVLDLKYRLNIFNITESCRSKHHGYDINEFYLMDNNDGYDVLEYKN